ncbi:integrin alpha-PS3-like [Coccinella septempunctata]|uniref:integrin alpha-PS3-like n=1 Tax=Coccinella septempunctata TaxID=41139 RepID=UPI001D08E789|nr:integrin alpha-PS3-like [Coccinella septempunctata]
MGTENIHFLCYLVLVIFQVSSFNIDTNNPVIYLDQTKYVKYVNPSEKTSFFGLSVLLIPGDSINSAWLQIGAPRGNSPSLQYRNPGIIFRCSIPNPCKYIEIDKEGSSTARYNNKFDDAWIGATMDVNLKYNRTVVCAPRWINVYKDSRRELDYRMLGACYWSTLNSDQYHKRLPLLGTTSDYIYKDRTTNESVYNWGQGEAGISVHMPELQKEMYIGAPGVFNWKGTTMIYRDRQFKDESPVANKYRLFNGLEEDPAEVLNDVNIANARLSGSLFAFGLFGYSVTSGYYYSRNQLLYAGGAPRSQNYRGQVLISQFGDNHDQKLNVKDTKEGSQFGEYFGAALATGDINQDGYDDLFVGAPFYHSSKYNEGRMYLYLGSPKGSLQDPVIGKSIDGTQTNGQFGAAITYLGDMNRDGNRYVAVAAPYAEEGSGVVYIFKGLLESYGIDSNPVQKIVGKSFLPNIRGFGMSISKPADIDANGYKDIAVGAYQSGHVVLLRSRPLVIVNSYFARKPNAISTQVDEFTVYLCHEFSAYGGMDKIRITRKIVVDENYKRAYLLGKEETEPFELQKSQPKCEELRIKLRKSLPNAYDPLTLAVTHYFVENKPKAGNVLVSNSTQGSDNFCMRCGVYDKFRSRQTVEESIPFTLGCGNDNVCLSELSFNSSFIVLGNRTDTFIRGSTNVIELEIQVSNSGEKAYLLNVQVDLPKELSFKKRPTLCEQNRTRIKCPLANPLEEGKTAVQILKLDMEYVNQKIDTDFLYINVTVLTNSLNKNQAFKRVKFYLKTEADITISGKSGEQSYSYGNESNSKVEFEQTYLIGKLGLSPVTTIAFQLYIPYAIQTKTENVTFISLYQPVGLLEGQSLIFESELPILVVNKFESSEGIGSDKIKEIREKRQVDTSEIEVLQNDTRLELNTANLQGDSVEKGFIGTTTYEINCEREDVLCGRIYGSAGPFEGTKNSAVLQLRLLLDVKNITGFLPKNAIIKYSTTGVVTIKDPPNLKQSGTRPDMAVVSSIFLNDTNKKKIDTWIIIVSVVLGLLLLLLLTLGLTKAGFFKRAKKEELEQLKAQTVYNDGKTNGAENEDNAPDAE